MSLSTAFGEHPTHRPRDLKGVRRQIRGEVHRVSQGLLIFCVRVYDIGYFVILAVFHRGFAYVFDVFRISGIFFLIRCMLIFSFRAVSWFRIHDERIYENIQHIVPRIVQSQISTTDTQQQERPGFSSDALIRVWRCGAHCRRRSAAERKRERERERCICICICYTPPTTTTTTTYPLSSCCSWFCSWFSMLLNHLSGFEA